MRKIWMLICLIYWAIKYPEIIDEIYEDSNVKPDNKDNFFMGI